MKKKDTKTNLLEATLKLISEKGYLGATTREIAQEAGVTELTLFRHFGSKEKLFEELLNTYTFLPRLRELLPEVRDLSTSEVLIVVGERFFESLKERKSMVRIMLSEITVYPDKIREVYNDMIQGIINTLAGYFIDQQKKSTVRDIPPEMIARAFLSMIFSYFQTEEIVRGRSITKSEIDDVVRSYVDIFTNGVVIQ